MVCPFSIIFLKNGYTVKYMPKQEKKAMNLTSEDRNKLKMAFFSPQIVNYNPIHIHLPDGPGGSFLFSEEKMDE